jgi:hypothetical protein
MLWINSHSFEMILFGYASVLRNESGRLDLLALLLTCFFSLCGIGLMFEAIKASRTGRIRFFYAPRYARTIDIYVERSASPRTFWFLFIFYSIGSCVYLILAASIAFGGLLQRLRGP